MRYLNDYAVIPIGYVKTQFPRWKRKQINKYTPKGRSCIHDNLMIDVITLRRLMENVSSQVSSFRLKTCIAITSILVEKRKMTATIIWSLCINMCTF